MIYMYEIVREGKLLKNVQEQLHMPVTPGLALRDRSVLETCWPDSLAKNKVEREKKTSS